MDLKAEIKWIQDELNEVEDPALLETFRNLLLLKKSSDLEDLEQYNREINLALEEITKGEIFSHEEVRKMIGEWQENSMV